MNVGALIDIGDTIGFVVARVGHKWEVVTLDGIEIRVSEDEIALSIQTDVDPADRRTVQDFLSQTRHKTDARSADSAVLWDLLRDLSEPVNVEAATHALFGTTDPDALLATFYALRDDTARFKKRKDGSFEPRSALHVQELQRQQTIEDRRQAAVQRFIKTLAAICETDGDRSVAVDEMTSNADDRLLFEAVQDLGCQPEFERSTEVTGWLDDLEQHTTLQLSGTPPQRVFQLMRHLGIWGPHEQLGLWRERIETEFPPSYEEAVATLTVADGSRTSFDALPTYTIDDATTKDYDDAISIQRLGESWRILIHIADVAAFIPLDSEIDRAASRRGVTIYLPTGKIPMLPRSLSEDRVSLVAGEPRPVVTFTFDFDAAFHVTHTSIERATIVVDENLTYANADSRIEGFDALVKARETLSQQRVQSGAANLPHLPESAVVVTGDEDPVVEIGVTPPSIARECVSEFAIATNELAAEYCVRHSLPCVFRTQDRSVVDDDEIASIPEGYPRHFAILRTMKRGEMTTIPTPHQGLGVRFYAQATSPIRRYGDLVVQRQIAHHLQTGEVLYDDQRIMSVMSAVEWLYRRARQLEIETTQYWMFVALDRTRPEFEGIVVTIRDGRENRPEVLFPSIGLRHPVRIQREVQLGDTIRAVVTHADARTGVLHLDEV